MSCLMRRFICSLLVLHQLKYLNSLDETIRHVCFLLISAIGTISMKKKEFYFKAAAGNTKPGLGIKCAHDCRRLSKYVRFRGKGLISTELHSREKQTSMVIWLLPHSFLLLPSTICYSPFSTPPPHSQSLSFSL